MKQMTRDPSAADKARQKDNARAGLISISLGSKKDDDSAPKNAGFKKSSFKPSGSATQPEPQRRADFKKLLDDDDDKDEGSDEAIFNRLGSDLYDPSHPSDCDENCPCKEDLV
jgi:hypothetical protein